MRYPPRMYLDSWLRTRAPMIGAQGLQATRAEGWDEDGRALSFELEGPRVCGRVTTWPDGACDIEVVEASTGAEVFYWPARAMSHELLDNMLAAMQARAVA